MSQPILKWRYPDDHPLSPVASSLGSQIVYPRLNPYKVTPLREDSDPDDVLFGVNPLLKGQLGRIDGVRFIESSPNLITELGGNIEKRTGYDDMTEKFKAIDEKIKREWGK